MLDRKQIKTLIIFQIIKLLIFLASISLLTIGFKALNNIFRYLFLIGDIFIIYFFSKSLTELEKRIQKSYKLY